MVMFKRTMRRKGGKPPETRHWEAATKSDLQAVHLLELALSLSLLHDGLTMADHGLGPLGLGQLGECQKFLPAAVEEAVWGSKCRCESR